MTTTKPPGEVAFLDERKGIAVVIDNSDDDEKHVPWYCDADGRWNPDPNGIDIIVAWAKHLETVAAARAPAGAELHAYLTEIDALRASEPTEACALRLLTLRQDRIRALSTKLVELGVQPADIAPTTETVLGDMPVDRAREITRACLLNALGRMGFGKESPLPECSLEEMLVANRIMSGPAGTTRTEGGGLVTTTVDPRGVAAAYALAQWGGVARLLHALGFELKRDVRAVERGGG